MPNAVATSVPEPGQFRDRFRIPAGPGNRDSIYLCGNSLGAQPHAATDAVEAELDRWARLGVAGHYDGPLAWAYYHHLLTDQLAELTGARPDEVIATGSVTANLHALMISFYRPDQRRRRIVIEKGAVPSDRYAVISQLELHGLDPATHLVELAPRRDGLMHEHDLEDYLERYGEQVALVLWPGVQYATGQVFDLDRITRAGHSAGAVVGFNLAHSIGNVELSLHESGPDFAVWCSHKYLNAGPGSVGGLFVHQRHSGHTGPRLSGWRGLHEDKHYRMDPAAHHGRGAARWQLSGTPVFSSAPLRGSLDVFADAGGIKALRRTSLKLTGHLANLIRERLQSRIDILTPLEPHRRGCQLSLQVRAGTGAGRELFERLEAHGVVCDWRQPDIIRAAPAPLYNTYDDTEHFVELMERLIDA